MSYFHYSYVSHLQYNLQIVLHCDDKFILHLENGDKNEIHH